MSNMGALDYNMTPRNFGNLNFSDLDTLDFYANLYGADMLKSSAREVNAFNERLMDKANEFSAGQAQKQMDFQKYMSSTAHQREMNDLIAAGLNPILTATGGQGAPMAAGAMAHSAMTSGERGLTENPMKNVAQSALAAKKFRDLEMKQLQSNIKQVGINEKQVNSQIAVNNKSIEMQDYNILKALEEINTLKSTQRYNSAAVVRELATAGAQSAAAALSRSNQALVDVQSRLKSATYDYDKNRSRYESVGAGSEAERRAIEAELKRLSLPRAQKQAAHESSIGGHIRQYLDTINPLRGLFKGGE
nr:MAG: DNA pilot protein [Microvirus sp.]